MSDAYHTALRKGHCKAAGAVERFVLGDNVAFVANAAHGLPGAYQTCDLLYTEPPWRAGLREFERRAGAEPVDWPMLMNRLVCDALKREKPLVFVSAQRIKGCPEPDRRIAGRLNGDRCWFWCYDIEPDVAPGTDSVELTHWLAERFDRVGDPFCGYGRTGRIFLERGKSFVMSDINPTCIGYIAARAEGWRA